MRALLDTNLLISYPLAPDKQGIIQQVIEAAFVGRYTLLLPSEVMGELSKKLTTKKYLVNYISASTTKNFITSLGEVAEVLPPITQTIPAIGRDIKDDYLVSGDHDLQVIKQIAGVKIISPAKFLEILNS